MKLGGVNLCPPHNLGRALSLLMHTGCKMPGYICYNVTISSGQNKVTNPKMQNKKHIWISTLKKCNKMQLYADIYLLLNYSTYFGRPSRPSSGVHKTVVAASGTDHTVWGASFFKRDHVVTSEKVIFLDSMICTRGCNYSFLYS